MNLISARSVPLKSDDKNKKVTAVKCWLPLTSVLPEAENEGDAIEMLRERVNTSQNKNRSRKV
jgi:hypothetical protein